jgi:hypothetical protein
MKPRYKLALERGMMIGAWCVCSITRKGPYSYVKVMCVCGVIRKYAVGKLRQGKPLRCRECMLKLRKMVHVPFSQERKEILEQFRDVSHVHKEDKNII